MSFPFIIPSPLYMTFPTSIHFPSRQNCWINGIYKEFCIHIGKKGHKERALVGRAAVFIELL